MKKVLPSRKEKSIIDLKQRKPVFRDKEVNLSSQHRSFAQAKGKTLNFTTSIKMQKSNLKINSEKPFCTLNCQSSTLKSLKNRNI